MNTILRKLKLNSFKSQLIIGMLTLLTFFVVTFMSISIMNNRNFLQEHELSQALSRSLALATSSKAWILSNDYVGAQEIVDGYLVYEDLVFASIINMDGQIIAHTDNNLVGKYIADKKRVAFLNNVLSSGEESTQSRVLLNDNKYIDIIRVVLDGNKPVGIVNIRIDQTEPKQVIKDSIIQSIWFAIIMLLVIFVFIFFTVNRLTQRLMRLIETMREVRLGCRNIKANEDEIMEVAAIAKEFNSMLFELNSSEKLEKDTKERLELAIAGSNDGLWDWNLLNDSIYYSPRMKEILGFKDDEFSNEVSAWKSRLHPDDIKNTMQAVEDNINAKTDKYENIHRIKHKDGHWVWILDKAKVVRDESGKAIRMIGTYEDITKEKEMQVQLHEQEEIMIAQSGHAAMGEMIGMIAHQWRQPITVISMGANNILVDIELQEFNAENFKQEAENILNQTEYLSKTIDDFRNFFRPNKEKDLMRVEDIVKESYAVIDKSLENNNIEFSFRHDNTDPILLFSRELLQVIINLLKNSKEALIQNKKDNRHIDVEVRDASGYIVLTISDNAGGIDKSIMSKIFNPYFSTKGKKIGTGLGLYMSKIIIEKHMQGTIKARNTDDGVCFEVMIPKKYMESK